jgi:hypothetical protein
MAKKKKNDNQDRSGRIIILVTSVLNLIRAIVDLIYKLTG